MPDRTSEQHFETIRGRDALVAYFSTPDCNVCKVLRPKVEQMVAAHEGIDFLYIDSARHPDVAGQHVVFAVPTIILFMNGREMRRFSRNLSLDDLERSLEHMQP